MQTYYRVYAKYKFQNNFMPLDLENGTQVINLIHASMIPSENLGKIKQIIEDNKDIKFKIVKIK